MQTYISILRGINVSGSKVIKMDALRKVFLDSGFINVKTYIQSGNVIFQEEKINVKDLEKRISKLIFENFSYEVPVIILESGELKSIIDHSPFLNDKSIDISYLHITFLSEEPARENIEKIIPIQFSNDEFKLIGKTVYLYCPNGYGKTKLNNSFFENKLNVTATTRNWKTANELFSIAEKLKTS